MVAPMLGGGHGFLQGMYGLLADQLIEARIVLGNGSAIKVSADSHPDLFWALRGAGHNFGIVTEFTYRIYDSHPNETWSYESFFFSGDQLEAVFEAKNEMMIRQPPNMIQFAIFLKVPQINQIKVVPDPPKP